ncbi:MAG: DNA topoisomerase IV [Aquimarina sp.]|nr:DNA topoisomerase IV [Aquimarina sp.]
MRYFIHILLFSLFLSTSSCYNIERNCNDFHTGTFEFEALIDGELAKTTFIRNDSIEIDFYQGKSDTSSIRWINDCEYIVKKINPKNMAEQKALHMKILTTDGNTYMFEYAIVGSNTKQKGVVKKIK